MFKNNNKGVASLATFSFILLLLVLIFILAYSYYKDSKQSIDFTLKEAEVSNSVHMFRSEILNLVVHNGSYMSYVQKYSSNDLEIYLINKTISGNLFYSGIDLEVNISSLGIIFCSNYTIYPFTTNTLNFNGSCVSVTS